MAGPITSAETGETLGMLKVERMAALDFNMTAVESFRVLCQWIGTSFARARTFEHAASRSFVGAGGILSASAEPPLTQFLKSLARRARFDLSTISIGVHVSEHASLERRGDVVRAVRASLGSGLRHTDIACERGTHGLDYVVLAPVCPLSEARRICDSIRASITHSLPVGVPVRLSVVAASLTEPAAAEANA